jgi:hypothetical protein
MTTKATTRMLRSLTRLALGTSLATAGMTACVDAGAPGEEIGSSEHEVTDVLHSAVERQSIGNCWIYAQASWIESMALSANPGAELDASQTYWTYWHWFDQVTGSFQPSEIETGGFHFTADQIVLDRGLMREGDFVPEDTASEMSSRQSSALARINQALSDGDFEGADGLKVRQIFDEAWELSPEVRGQLDQAFGEDGESTLRQGASVSGTDIVDPETVRVRFTERRSSTTSVRDATLVDAIESWNEVRYPFDSAGRREFLRRVQRALHDRQPVIITWDVDFNALENSEGERQGSFNKQTLEESGAPGHQGGHMTVLEDYAAETEEFGLLAAGVTLDPTRSADAAKLAAALLDSTEIKLLRIKNSWGSERPDREFAPGFPGYHDLWMDYMNGPMAWCPDAAEPKSAETCTGESVPLREVLLPPGY